jgi:hypothetical protein
MFKILQPVPNCYLFLCDNNKELALTFCRVQEYYESDLPELKDKHFTFEQFIDSQMDQNGNVDYFSYWDGFNVPSNVLNSWLGGITSLTKWEDKLIAQLPVFSDKPFYVIGALEKDKTTINHEIAHALYNLDSTYNAKMVKLTVDFMDNHKKDSAKLIKILKILGYGENVILDEIQAYLSTDPKKNLVEDFELDYDTLKPLIQQYRKVLREYNTYDFSA